MILHESVLLRGDDVFYMVVDTFPDTAFEYCVYHAQKGNGSII